MRGNRHACSLRIHSIRIDANVFLPALQETGRPVPGATDILLLFQTKACFNIALLFSLKKILFALFFV
jgi:hypothetical protein